VNAPVWICISTYATPGFGLGIGGLTDFSSPVGSPPAAPCRIKESLCIGFEDWIDQVIEQLVAADRKMTMKNHSIRQPKTDTIE
jgi:hypothetical protein